MNWTEILNGFFNSSVQVLGDGACYFYDITYPPYELLQAAIVSNATTICTALACYVRIG